MTIEALENGQRFLNSGLVTQATIKKALDLAIKQVNANIQFLDSQFPTPAAKDGQYGRMGNTEWTTGFWTGILWLAYEYTNDSQYLKLASQQVESFANRINKKIAVDHHDLGFLYLPSCVSAYQLTNNQQAYKAALAAAEQLSKRFQSKGGFIQAWGSMQAGDNYRLIIDALLNIPLLYWADEHSQINKYAEMADSHYKAATTTVIRNDGSTYHTYYFDPKTGRPLYGATRQGYSDESSWARGQAWAVYGIPLHYRYRKTSSDEILFERVLNYFLNRLPADYVPYWDLIFKDGDDQPRDSSAASIAVCGINEALKNMPESNPNKLVYKYAEHAMMQSLITNYQQTKIKAGSPIVKHSVYSWHSGKGVDEGNIWGDYFYLEALIRFYKDWQLYW